MTARTALAFLLFTLCANSALAEPRVLDAKLHHLRAGPTREWADFPEKPEAANLTVRFESKPNDGEWALRLRQQDVRQTWKVVLNDKEIGRLRPDENDMIVYFPVPKGAVVAGENTLVVEQIGKTSDDVRVGEVSLDERSVEKALGEVALQVSIGDSLPCRITVVHSCGAMMTVGTVSGKKLAARPGVIYTGTGVANFTLPAGDYTIYAGRGPAYGIVSRKVSFVGPDAIKLGLSLRREVLTPGWISCDTHVHTLTYSGHGDADVNEQVLAIAGEGLELPIATEHNRNIDYHEAAVKQGVRKFFTPVVGNEVTTSFGHFNAFPLRADGPVPDHKLKDWTSIFKSIDDAGARITILNHPRDLHSGFRPFGPERHVGLSGERLDGWELGGVGRPAPNVCGMEAINSGAQQTDPMRLFRDWFGLLNRGVILTPVGASDSHDVSRYIVGQARTYIRSKSTDPGKIDVDEVIANFRKGRVMVSCGLVTEIKVNDKFGPGDLAPSECAVTVRVLGPSWVKADKVELYANGYKIREAKIAGPGKNGVLWEGEWMVPRFRHDVHLVAIATGPGVKELYWPIAKPYQPTSPVVERRVIGASGAVFVDGDEDGKWTSPYEYARRLSDDAGKDLARFVGSLGGYDEAVAVQAASLLQARGISPIDPEIKKLTAKTGGQVERGFAAYAEAWRQSQVAKAEKK